MILRLTTKKGVLNLLDNTRFILSGVEALHGVETDFITSESPYTDGVNVEDVKALPRGIELTFKVRSDVKENIDYFTNIVKSKQQVTLYEEEGDRQIEIKGVATIPPYSRMMALCEIKLEIYCGQPYWEDINYFKAIIDSIVELLYFPVVGQYFTQEGRPFGVIDTSLEKTFENTGDVAVGMNILITALGEVTNPKISCSTGEQNGNYMKLNLTLAQNDQVEINTEKGNKYIKINGVETKNGVPILSYLEWSGYDWLQLEVGENTFDVVADSGQANMYFTITYKRRYE